MERIYRKPVAMELGGKKGKNYQDQLVAKKPHEGKRRETLVHARSHLEISVGAQ